MDDNGGSFEPNSGVPFMSFVLKVKANVTPLLYDLAVVCSKTRSTLSSALLEPAYCQASQSERYRL